MKLKVKEKTIRDLKNIKGKWLLRGKEILIIRDFKYESVKPEPKSDEEEEVQANTKVFKRKRFKKKPDGDEKYYVTDMKINGYNSDLKFVGTFYEEYCERLIEAHNDNHATLDLFDLATAWEHVNDQIMALKAHFEEQELDEFETKYKDIIDLVIAGKDVQACNAYREIVPCSLKLAIDFVRDLKKTYVDN